MSDADIQQVPPYELMGGKQGIDDLVDRFYDTMDTLPQARTIRAMHGPDLTVIRHVLKLYLAQWLGGPQDYSRERGHPMLRGRHLGFSIGLAERDAWMQCMDAALSQVACEPQVRDQVREAMLKLADWMRNQPNNP